jgi:hypothetical protein
MQDYKHRIDKLVADAAECELIGSLAGDATKRATFRRLAEQFRITAGQLKAELEGTAFVPVSDRHFLLQQAARCRALAAATSDEAARDAVARMAEEFEAKAKTFQ